MFIVFTIIKASNVSTHLRSKNNNPAFEAYSRNEEHALSTALSILNIFFNEDVKCRRLLFVCQE